MEIRQRITRARTKPKNTPALYALLEKQSKDLENSNGIIRQRVTKMRTRSDGKAKGVAIRKK